MTVLHHLTPAFVSLQHAASVRNKHKFNRIAFDTFLACLPSCLLVCSTACLILAKLCPFACSHPNLPSLHMCDLFLSLESYISDNKLHTYVDSLWPQTRLVNNLSRRIVVEVVVLASNLCGVGLRRGALPSIGHDNIRMLQCCEC